MRAVCDLNVVVSGLIQPRGPSGRVLALVRDRGIELVACQRWPEEMESVLARRKFRRHWSVDQARLVRLSLTSVAEIRPDPPSTPERTRDPDDDYLVALALAAGCDAIVSGDRHLLEYGGPPPVWTPRELLSRLEVEDPRGL